MADTKSLHKEVFKSLFLAFKRLSLYSVEHPISKEILSNLFTMFSALLKEQPEVLVAVGLNAGEMVVNNDPLDSATLGVGEVCDKFKSLKLDGAAFQAGLTHQELSDFVRAMAASAVLDGGRPAPVPEILLQGTEHIKIRKLHYEKIDDDQKVVGKEAAGGSKPSGGVESLFEDSRKEVYSEIKEFLTGKTPQIEADSERVFEELDRNVSKVAQAVIDSAKETGDFEGVIKKFVAWLSEHVVFHLVEKKRDPGRFIQKLFDSFHKEDLSAFSSSAESVIESCADDIKIAMLEAAFSVYRASPKKGLGSAAKILADEEDPQRIFPKLIERLTQAGNPAEEAKAFVEKVEAELAKDEDVLVSKKKLAKLTRLSERFDQELGRRVTAATQALTRENSRLTVEKERAEGVMRHLADGLVVVDSTGKIVMMNPAAEKMMGREMKESVGQSLAECIKDEHLLAMAKGSLEEGDETKITTEIELKSKDELTKRILRASGAVVENENGKTVGMVTVLSDVTREKELDEMKANFVNLVTHELRTPMVAIQKSVELILSQTTGPINDDQQRFLAISKNNLDRLNRLINDLLDMARLDAGRVSVRPVSFDLRDVIKDVCSTLASWAGDKQIPVLYEPGTEPMTVFADRDRITQVLVNLLGNALKFTPVKGEVRVFVKSLDSKEGLCPEPCVEVAVTDTGIGIDPKDVERIFNKFEQASLVAPAGTTGTGLGLPIAKEIVQLHHGAMWVESEKGKGSRFIFVIPKQFKDAK